MKNFDIIKFGNDIRKLREKLNYSREYLAEKANISIDTIKRLESGKGNLRLSSLISIINSLDNISDLNHKEYFTSEKISDSILLKKINVDIKTKDIKNLNEDYDNLRIIFKNISDREKKAKIGSYLYLIRGVLLKWDKKYKSSQKTLLHGLKTLKNDFQLDKFNTYDYNELESRYFLNILLNYRLLGDVDYYHKMIDFFINGIIKELPSISRDLLISSTYNYANYLYRLGKYDDSIYYYELLKKNLKKDMDLNMLSYAQYGIGISKFDQGKKTEAEDFFKSSVYISSITGSISQKNFLIYKIKKASNLNLNKNIVY